MADETGAGAVLGAPFMLATIAMASIGLSALYFGSRRAAGSLLALTCRHSAVISRFPSRVFVRGGGGVRPIPSASRWYRPRALVLYVVYVRQTLASGHLIKGEDLGSLHLEELLTRVSDRSRRFGQVVPIDEPPLWMVFVQIAVALLVIVAGAHPSASEVEFFSAEVVDVPAALIALPLAPFATEPLEKFNSAIWISEGKDTLAIGSITGAMVFQGTLPVTLGTLFTTWDLGVTWGTIGFLNTLSAVLALLGGGMVLLRTQFRSSNRMRPVPFPVAGFLCVAFVTVVTDNVVIAGVAAASL